MAIDFFEKELGKVQDKFNQNFGSLDVCNIKLRQSVILGIISMSLIMKRIKKQNRKEDIKQFMRHKEALTVIFNKIERSNHADTSTARKQQGHGTDESRIYG